jgi:hypothetical protein
MSIMTGPAQAPSAPAPVKDPDPTSNGRQRLLLLGGGGLAVVVVAAMAYFFLFSGSDAPAPTTALPAPQASASPSASAAAPAVAPLKTFAGKTAKNPFKSLAPAESTGSTGTTTGTTGTTGDTGTTTGTTGTTTGTTTTVPASSPVPLTLTVKSVKSDKSGATLTVKPQGKATKTYSPLLGATFATYFRLTGFGTENGASAPTCVLLQYGDASTMLCKGEVLTIK